MAHRVDNKIFQVFFCFLWPLIFVLGLPANDHKGDQGDQVIITLQAGILTPSHRRTQTSDHATRKAQFTQFNDVCRVITCMRKYSMFLM